MDGFRVMPHAESRETWRHFCYRTGNKSVLTGRAIRKNEGRAWSAIPAISMWIDIPALEKLSSGKPHRAPVVRNIR